MHKLTAIAAAFAAAALWSQFAEAAACGKAQFTSSQDMLKSYPLPNYEPFVCGNGHGLLEAGGWLNDDSGSNGISFVTDLLGFLDFFNFFGDFGANIGDFIADSCKTPPAPKEPQAGCIYGMDIINELETLLQMDLDSGSGGPNTGTTTALERLSPGLPERILNAIPVPERELPDNTQSHRICLPYLEEGTETTTPVGEPPEDADCELNGEDYGTEACGDYVPPITFPTLTPIVKPSQCLVDARPFPAMPLEANYMVCSYNVLLPLTLNGGRAPLIGCFYTLSQPSLPIPVPICGSGGEITRRVCMIPPTKGERPPAQSIYGSQSPYTGVPIDTRWPAEWAARLRSFLSTGGSGAMVAGVENFSPDFGTFASFVAQRQGGAGSSAQNDDDDAEIIDMDTALPDVYNLLSYDASFARVYDATNGCPVRYTSDGRIFQGKWAGGRCVVPVGIDEEAGRWRPYPR